MVESFSRHTLSYSLNRALLLIKDMPMLSIIGIYLIIRAQVGLFDEPYFASQPNFKLLVIGMFLVFTQGWVRRANDWHSATDPDARPQYLLDTRRWIFAALGLGVSIYAVWSGILSRDWLTPKTALLFSLGIGLMVFSRVAEIRLIFLIQRLWSRLRHQEFTSQIPPLWSDMSWRTFLPIFQWIIALIGIRLCLYAGWRAIDKDMHAVTLLKMWGAGISLMVLGFVPIVIMVAWFADLLRSFRRNWLEWLFVLALLGAAMIVRIAWLETQPYIQAEDEAAFAIQAVDLVGFSHWIDSPFRYGVWHHPMVYHMLQVFSIQAIGQTIFAARLPSALLGAFTVPAVYLMGRRMFNWRVGALAAIFMVTFPFHVHFSRISINQVGDPLFTALTFAFLTQAMRTGNKMEFALGGVALGFSQYFYSAARLVPILMLIYVGLYAILNFKVFLRFGSMLAVTGIIAGSIAFPNLYYVYRDTERPLSPRLDQVSIFKTGDVEAGAARDELREYWEYQFSHSFGGYIHRLDESGFYGPHNSILGWYGGVPFLIGIALCLRCWYDPRWLILPMWVAGTAILGGILLVDPPHYPRFVSVVPGLAVLVAIGGVYIIEMLLDIPQQLQLKFQFKPIAKVAIMLGVALFIAQLNLFDYVGSYLPKRLYYGERTVNLNEVAWKIQEVDDLNSRTLYFYSGGEMNLSGSNLVRYQIKVRGKEYQLTPEEVHDLPAGDYLFVVAPSRFEDFDLLLNEIPWSTVKDYQTSNGDGPLARFAWVSLPQPAN